MRPHQDKLTTAKCYVKELKLLAVASTSTNSLTNYWGLKDRVGRRDLRETVTLLNNLFKKTGKLKRKSKLFSQLLTKRALRKNGSSQGFVAVKPCLVNQTLHKLAKLLLSPTDQGQVLAHLLPQARVMITVDTNSALALKTPIQPIPSQMTYDRQAYRQALLAQQSSLSLEASDLSSVPASFSSLAHYVCVDSLVFDCRVFARMNLKQLLVVHDLLMQQYPNLAEAIYCHNQQLRTLKAQIDMIKRGGAKPREKILQLANALAVASEHKLGGHFAHDIVNVPLATFREFLDSLPESLCNKLLALPCKTPDTLADVLRRIENQDCSKQSSESLMVCAKLPDMLLDTPIKLSKSGFSELNQRYGGTNKAKAFVSIGEQKEPPRELLKAVLAEVNFSEPGEFPLLLLEFPVDVYPLLFQRISPEVKETLYRILGDLLGDSFFDAEQTKVIIDLISSDIVATLGLKEALPIALQSGSMRFLRGIVESHTEGEINQQMRERVAIEVRRGNGIHLRSYYQTNLLHLTAPHPELLTWLLKFYDKESLSITLLQLSSNLETVLKHTGGQVDSLRVLLQKALELGGQELVTQCILKRGRFHFNALHLFADRAHALAEVLKALPLTDRFNALLTTDGNLRSAISRICLFPDSFVVALKSLPDDLTRMRLLVCLGRHYIGHTVFSKHVFSSISLARCFSAVESPWFDVLATVLSSNLTIKANQSLLSSFFYSITTLFQHMMNSNSLSEMCLKLLKALEEQPKSEVKETLINDLLNLERLMPESVDTTSDTNGMQLLYTRFEAAGFLTDTHQLAQSWQEYAYYLFRENNKPALVIEHPTH